MCFLKTFTKCFIVSIIDIFHLWLNLFLDPLHKYYAWTVHMNSILGNFLLHYNLINFFMIYLAYNFDELV